MMELLATERGQLRVRWQGFIYECGPKLARAHALKLAEAAGAPGRALVKCQLVWFAGYGQQRELEWRGSKDQAAAFAVRLNLEADAAELQASLLQRLRAEEAARARAEQLARYGGGPEGGRS
jgi:hypothetical protein